VFSFGSIGSANPVCATIFYSGTMAGGVAPKIVEWDNDKGVEWALECIFIPG
jgi:hypothetical protein